MTSPKHGRLIEIFRAKPETLVEALRAWLGLKVPTYSKLEVLRLRGVRFERGHSVDLHVVDSHASSPSLSATPSSG